MHDSLRVGRLQAAGGLDEAVDRLAHRQRSAVPNDAVEVSALDVVHDQKMNAAVFVGVECRDDIGMLEPAGGLDLAAKPHDGLFVASEGRGQDLECADPPQPAVAAP